MHYFGAYMPQIDYAVAMRRQWIRTFSVQISRQVYGTTRTVLFLLNKN